MEIAREALKKGEGSAALFWFQVVLAVAPQDAEANGCTGALLLARGDAAGAIGPLRIAADRAPDSGDVHLALARCAARLGRIAEARAALTEAERAAGENAALLAGAPMCMRRSTTSPRQSACAVAWSRCGRPTPARAALGYLLLLFGARAEGEAEWRRALELDPGLPGLRERLDRLQQ